jgi:hypothetical protein
MAFNIKELKYVLNTTSYKYKPTWVGKKIIKGHIPSTKEATKSLPATIINKGNVGILQNGYIQNVPLPKVAPQVQSASQVMSHVTSHRADQLLVPCSHVMSHVTSHGADQLLVPCSHVMCHVTSYDADHLLVP